jgi:hypothetical protein
MMKGAEEVLFMEVSCNLRGGTEEVHQQGMWIRIVGDWAGVESGICLMQVRNVTALAKLLRQMIFVFHSTTFC